METPFSKWLESLWNSMSADAQRNFIRFLITQVDVRQEIVEYQVVINEFADHYGHDTVLGDIHEDMEE